MIPDGRVGAVVRETGPGEVASLLVLRALIDRADPRGVVTREELTEELRKRYGSADGLLAFDFESSALPRLTAEGIIEHPAPPEGDGGHAAPRWVEIRLTPRIHRELLEAEIDGGLQDLIEYMDQTIQGLLDTHAPPAEPAVPRAPESPGADGGVPRAGLATLRAEGLVKVYRKRRVVNEVNVHVSQGEIVGLLGPNGAGKTTTFYMMVGLIAPDAGKVYLGSENITGVPMYRRARRGIGYLAQEPSVFRRLTVEENILAVLQMMGLPRAEQRRRLEELLDELHIKHLRTTKAYALSGGERRRLEITRALVGLPKFMLLDEPFAGVDPIAVHDIQQIVSDLRRRGIGVLISDHNVEQTLDIVDRAYIMYDGRVRVSGTVSELVWNAEVAEIYLGPTLTARMRERYPIPEKDQGE
ncbi:MAG TPA: LPS export ABC transporter ATP-binding protein [Longimicrobiaceae bacterium]|nr:LPS export ABC transporter ATP-binding protein [Longimicrobiaceae bacterium]